MARCSGTQTRQALTPLLCEAGGVARAACCVHTYKLSLAVVDDLLTPNQKTALLAKKWCGLAMRCPR